MPMAEDLAPIEPPTSFAELRDRLASGSVRLPKRLKQVATFALAQPDEIALGTVAKIAEDAGVQPSALVRFGQALGFSGFTDLQAVFRERLRNQVSNYDERMLSLRAKAEGASKSAAFLDGLCESATRSITALHERIDIEAVEEATRLLAGAETVYLVAQRRSFPVTSYLSYALGKLAIKNVLVGSPMGTDPETLSFATARDAALAISFTPYASATVDHARLLAGVGVPLVVITDSPFSPLTSAARLWFEVVEADFQGFRSLSASLALAMTLALGIADLRRDASGG
ncbi:MurR/RpiR family transcriptional regulator [Aureimonas sp. AU4]|uniref:MurR/RpiR family transcriptional regulator n=1 Tax=Aureimonas sp. AU4 TaxID=1638163 RepID=UPI0007863AD1|nr:MurR/RpiR family transcriptional regulator [Aureimonas sp. AU4]